MGFTVPAKTQIVFTHRIDLSSYRYRGTPRVTDAVHSTLVSPYVAITAPSA